MKKDLSMSKNLPSPAPQAKGLAALVLDRTVRPVTDELTALRPRNPSLEAYAAIVNDPPSLVAMAARACHHAEEVSRFLQLTQRSDSVSFGAHLGQLHAMMRLNAIATVAIALVPARTGADRHARREQGHAFLRDRLEDPETNALVEAARLAFGLDDVDAAEIAADAIAYAGRSCARTTPGLATTHRLEEQASLRLYRARQPDAAAVLAEANRHQAMAQRFHASLAEDALSPREHDLTEAAAQGAQLHHHLALARLAFAPTLTDRDAMLAPIYAAVSCAPPQRAGALLLAIATGDHARTMEQTYPA